ncbi:N-acetyltransferase YodP [Desulfosarcina alkanivorans]|uniref:N-acetyltransferase YodP n=1 Tax=Desulfosarcina alkanivorans TaxID=571177 RepID=A0A5K7YFP3_9BACT|nr:putative beta-lysine N-acetyltransferase [Desulfosarcina alkanivorans]BBO67868.1 N-acetyltransferase YodP [Desulfosarcina alkanivorans]
MADRIETIDGSLIQHGRHNDRIYLMHLHGMAAGNLIPKLDRMARDHGYTKIFAKVPATRWKAFKSAGYTREALIPGFFRGRVDGLFIAKFFSEQRRKAPPRQPVDPPAPPFAEAPPAGRCAPPVEACTPSDAGEMGALYHRAFDSYPFPIHRPDYLTRVMGKNAFYWCIRVEKRIAAIAAAEIDPASQACEMTDFATLPGYTGRGFAQVLLGRLMDEARRRDVKTAYTIARDDSRAMNRVFQKTGYGYAGRLINNSQIGGRIRSMNVWYRVV